MGFITNDAVLHAPESRTSSPVSIPRNNDTLEHPVLKDYILVVRVQVLQVVLCQLLWMASK